MQDTGIPGLSGGKTWTKPVVKHGRTGYAGYPITWDLGEFVHHIRGVMGCGYAI